MSYTPLSKAVKSIWANQLIRLPSSVVYVKFKFVYTTTSYIVNSTSSNVFLRRGSEKTFNNYLGLSNVFPSAVFVQVMRWQLYHLARLVVKVARFHDMGTR